MRVPAMVACMPRNQDTDKDVWADCRKCGGVDGLFLNSGKYAATCAFCYDESTAAEIREPVMNKPAQANAAKATTASTKTATSINAAMEGIAAAKKADLTVRVMSRKKCRIRRASKKCHMNDATASA